MGRRRVERWWRLADLGLVEQGSESSRRSRVRLGKRIEFGVFFPFLFSLCTTVGGRGIQGMVGPMSLHKCLYFGKKIECYKCLHIGMEGVLYSISFQDNHAEKIIVCLSGADFSVYSFFSF